MDAGGTRITVCGRLQVELAGERVEDRLRGRQGRLLFAYLLLNRARAVRREELVEALWPGGTAPGGADALNPVLSRLRSALGAGRVAGRGELRLELGQDASVDWEAAQAGVRTAREALGAGDAAAARDQARAALDVLDGGLLPGLEAEWLDPRRAELDDLLLAALETLAAAGVRLGGADLGRAEAAARRAVE